MSADELGQVADRWWQRWEDAMRRRAEQVARATRLAILLVVFGLAAAEARAQTTTTWVESAGEALRTVMFGSEASDTGALSGNSAEVLYGLLLGETTTFPMGSSAGGFTWVFDTDVRVPMRRSRSFGPMFAERPFTTGKGRLNVGAMIQHASFSSVGGQSLSEIEEMASYGFGEEIYRYTSSIDIVIDRTIGSATYGLHDRVDVGVIVPFGSARVSGFSTYYQLYQGAVQNQRENASGSSFGIGDVVIRTKAALTGTERFATAAALDVRLPTGNPEKLMGTGRMQAKVLFIGGASIGGVNPHLNVGYTFGGSGMEFGADNRWIGSFGDPELIERQPSEALEYTVGADISVTSRLTVAGDVIGRVVRNSASMTRYDSGASEADREVFMEVTPGTVHLLLGAVGAKFSIGGSWLLTGTVLFPLNDNGITPAVTPVIGFERAF
jgi:hypothetical protein